MKEIPAASDKKLDAREIKQYLYHAVPSAMEGTVLHPLNTLKNVHPRLYASKSEKYKDRRQVMEQFIPTLECAWNDVLHMTAVHPAAIKQALIEAGRDPRERKFYQIDPATLDPKQTTVYLFNDLSSEGVAGPGKFVEFDPQNVEHLSVLPEATKKYFREMVAAGKRPFVFVGVPHILHKGSIDISNLSVITV